MFTGLIEDIGTVASTRIDSDGVGRRITISASFAAALTLGESVSVNGTCLTVVDSTPQHLDVQVSPTTLELTTMGMLEPGQRVNLERSVTPATRLGGHWVLGHVDTRGTVQSITANGDAHHIVVAYPIQYQRWVLPQGSVTLDGISLTIVELSEGRLGVTVIPHTWSHTIIQDWRGGSPINMEFDVLGKYVEQLAAPYVATIGGITHERPVL